MNKPMPCSTARLKNWASNAQQKEDQMKHVTIITAFAASLLIAMTVDAKPASDELRTQVNSLYAKDVAWREIQWRTCLIDGLRESREQKKPVMLWIFIDRPIDDERC